VGTGNSKCEQHRAVISTHWPIVVAVIYLCFHISTFGYVFYYYVTIKPWPRVDVGLLCLIGLDRVAYLLMVTFSVFHSKWMLYGAAAVMVLPLLVDGIVITINRETIENLACVRWWCYVQDNIRNLLEHKDLTTWFFHNLKTGLENGLVLTFMDLIWPALRLSLLCIAFTMGTCLQVCLSCADVKCTELWQKDNIDVSALVNKAAIGTEPKQSGSKVKPANGDNGDRGKAAKGNKERPIESGSRRPLEGGRVRISVTRTTIRILLQGGIIFTNSYFIGRSIWEPIWVFGLGSEFPSTSMSAGVSMALLAYVIVTEWIFPSTFHNPVSFTPLSLSPATVTPENEVTRPVSQQKLSPSPTITAKKSEASLPNPASAPPPRLVEKPKTPPPVKIREDIVAGVMALHRERQEYRERRASTTGEPNSRRNTRGYGRSVSFDVKHAQSKGYSRAPSFAHDMEVIDVV
jgi:hypothetical protein